MTLLDLPSTIGRMQPIAHAIEQRRDRAARAQPHAPINPTSPAFLHCRDITRARARNFSLGLRLAPEPKRSALLALYTWMRYADDLADAVGPEHTTASRAADLAALRAATIDAFDLRPILPPSPHSGPAKWEEGRGEGCDSRLATNGTSHADAPTPIPTLPWWPAFLATLNTYPIPLSIFTDTLDALDADTRGVDLATTHDLARYCDRVAGTVALACVTIWGVRRTDLTARAHHAAILRARAVQLTNILRDLREDLNCNPRRAYLPLDSLLRHDLTPESLLAWLPPDRAAALIGDWIDQARQLYNASSDLESLIDPSCARTSWALGAVYRSLLDSIAEDPARAVRQRISVPRRRKLSIALTGWLGVGLPG